MAALPFGFTLLLILLFNGWQDIAQVAAWTCSNLIDDAYVSNERDYYCYHADDNGVPPIPSIEGEDPLLMGSFSSRNDKVQSCIKASMGRGYKYVALFNNGECRSSGDATSTYDEHGYERTTRQYCYYYCYWGCYRSCYSYLVYCGDGYGDSTMMNLYKLDAYDVILWIRVKRNAFATNNYYDFFNESSSVSTDVNLIIQSWVEGTINGSQICGINNGILMFWRPDTSDFLMGHYRFPTSFKNISYIASRMVGMTTTNPDAQIIGIQQYKGYCSDNPYARADIDLSKDITNPSVYLKQDDNYIYGYAYYYCTSPDARNYTWEVALLRPDNTTVGALVTVNSAKSWTLAARSLNYGLYYVQYTISTPENPFQMSHDYGFMRITPGPLYVYITKGFSGVYIEKRDMVVDGSESYDPDFFAQKGNYTGMVFTWVCYASGESVDMDKLRSLQEVYPDGSPPILNGSEVPPPQRQNGGCFDTGPGKLPFNTPTITFNNSLMVLGNRYYIVAEVRKGQRVRSYSQYITIAEAPPAFNVSCFSNCKSSAIINLRLGLKAHCIDTASKCELTLSYTWYMYYKDEQNLEGDWIEETGFHSHLLTSYSGVTEVLLQENFLQINRVYRITLSVMTTYGAEDFFHYDFRPNTPPQGGICVMDKYVGQAVLDLFRLDCSGWNDYDLPLTYQVTVPKLDNTYIVLAKKNSSSMPLSLPVGDQNDAFRLRLEVYVIDSLAANTKVNVSLIVWSPEASTFENQLSGLIGELENLVNEEDNELAVQMSVGVLSAVDNLKKNNETTTNTSLLRENIVNSITKLRMNDTDSVNQIASVLVEATKEEAALTPTSGFTSLEACNSMSTILAMEGNNTETTDAVENAGKQVVLVAGGVLGGAVLSSKTTNSSELENLAKKALEMTDNLAKIFLERLLPGEHPAEFYSPRLSMQLYRQHAGAPMPQRMGVSGGSFLLPNLNLGITSGFLDRNVKFSDLDPFIWAKNHTYKAETPVISLSFKDERGNPIPVHDTESDIEINIPVPEKNNGTFSQPTHFLNPNDSMAYHTFNITHHDTAFSIRIEPANETRYLVYLRYGKRPNETHYDYQFLIPDFTTCLPPKDENCTVVKRFMQCLGVENVTYHDANFTKPGQPTSCGPPKNDSVPEPAPPENGEPATSFECPDMCNYGNLTFSDCSCDEIPDVSFLFPNTNTTEDVQTCRDFIKFPLCPNDTMLCKNSVNLMSCYLLEFERFERCRSVLSTPRKLFYDMYGKCLKDPFKVFFNHSVGKPGKWYVGVQVYIPPIVNDTEEEEEKDITSENWWSAVKKMTDKDEVKDYLEEYTLAEVNEKFNTTADDIKDCEYYYCRWNRWSCKWYDCEKIVEIRLDYWRKNRPGKKKRKDDDDNDDDDDDDDGDDDDDDNDDDGDDDDDDYDDDDDGDDDDDDDDDRRRKRRSLSLNSRDSDLEIKKKRLCIIVKEKPPPPKIGEKMSLVEEPSFDVNTSSLYSIDVRLYTCLFWDEENDEWSTKGCKPGPDSTEENLQCFCNHLTSFGGNLFPTPNNIDFQDVFIGFASLGETGNVGVIIAVGVFFLLYIVCVVFARRADKRDKEQVSVSIPVKTRRTGSHAYEIVVYTGMFGSSGTTANVSMVINAENGETEILPLMDNTGTKNPFARGSVSSFVAKLPFKLSQLNYIRVWHDNSGLSPSWNLYQIVIRHVATDQKWFFICNRWLAVEKDDGSIEKVIFVADKKQMAGFQNLFYQRASKDIGDGHLWFSVYTRPPNSSFTRVQRLTCCISLLFSSMLANAMFYEVGSQQPGFQVQFGPINFNWTEMMIGIQSSLVIVPVNLLIIAIFRYTRPEEKKSERSRNSKSKKKKKCKLPRWFIYIAYTLALLTSLTGAAFTMFYSMIWGKEKSNKWITSVIISLVQDIFFLQPLKVIVVASLLSLLFRKPPEEDREEVQSDEILEDAGDTSQGKNKMEDSKPLPDPYSTPDPMVVALARERKLNELKMWKIISQLGLQLFVVFLLAIASYGSRSNDRYWLNKNMKDIFNVKIDKVRDLYTFWWWCENYMLPSLYTTPWYNGKKFDEEKDFFSNKISFIVGLPRLRQIRVKPEPCCAWPPYPELKKWFPRCYDHYSDDNRGEVSSGPNLDLVDISPSYNTQSGSSSSDDNSNSNSSSSSSNDETFPTIPIACEHTVKYQDSVALGTLPIVTAINTYKGGGLVADLGYDIHTARQVIAGLQEDIWINRLTRIVILELITFQPATNLFAFTRYSFEALPTGGIIPSYRIDPISFSGSGRSLMRIIFIACYALIVLILLYSIITQIRELRKMRLKYFKDIWNLIELAFICCTIATIVIFFFKEEYIRRLIEEVQANPYARMSFDYVALWTDIESVVLAIVIFLATMKFLRILKFNKHIAIMAKSISISKGPMLSYSIVFIVELIGFAVMGHMIFGRSAYMFSTYTRSVVNVFEMILGKGTNYDELESINRYLGPFFLFVYFFSMTIFLMNFFMAILNDSFTEAREILDENPTEDSEMSEFMGEYAVAMLKEISDELRGMTGKKMKYQASREAKESDFFLY